MRDVRSKLYNLDLHGSLTTSFNFLSTEEDIPRRGVQDVYINGPILFVVVSYSFNRASL